jgi:transcriptional regulator with GAF, ATPase, and Fis domain
VVAAARARAAAEDGEGLMPGLTMPSIESVLPQLDALAGEISTALLRLSADDLDAALERSLRQIVETLDAEQGSLLWLGDDDELFEVVASCTRHEGTGHDADGALTQHIVGLLRSDQVRVVKVPDDLALEVFDPGSERLERIRSAVGVPIRVAGQRACALILSSVRDMATWSDQIVGRVKLLAEILTFAVDRRSQSRALRLREAELTRLSTQLKSEAVYLREEIQTLHGFNEIIGDSPVLRDALDRVREVASTDATVLLLGETGTGKELFARAVHDRSPRRHRTLVRVNCAALPPSLIESELFGHERGAFTGAVSMRQGRFELADKGTIFLDEIGDLPPELQAKLLRVLQEGEFERVGSSHIRKVDVRVIAATHRSLTALTEAGQFRPDLFYRLSVYPIHLPALHERPEDIPRLVWFFVHRRQRALHRQIKRIPQAVMDTLQAYSWPGNVRELENVIERAMIRSTGDTLVLDNSFGPVPRSSARAHADSLDTVVRRHIEDVLRRCGWRISGKGNAADHLNLHPNTLRFRMKKLGITRPLHSAEVAPRQGV